MDGAVSADAQVGKSLVQRAPETVPKARVLREDGQPIAALYATGNTSTAVMGPSYPGAGSTIAPAMTFGFIATHHLAGV